MNHSNNKMKKNKHGGTKKKMAVEQFMAYKSISEWVYLDNISSPAITIDDDFKGSGDKREGKGGRSEIDEIRST
ncbi:hypothetical protein L6452_28041 [Arctium lappa]|uniref:Uncharacterized protein n=1 Tax=Arctium lappa TaxID=4217 RepID=A0ACB8ZXM1_ARCLA|nr:hypothetical protein L6452_28041 [Arctium lappa]